MKIIAVELENFRRFRKPVRLNGFQPGMNVVVEPNEAGKSTFLEALYAAIFIRSSAKTELVRSFCPYGDEVGPRVALEFEVGGKNLHVEKRFLKAASAFLVEDGKRFEGEAAEDRLQDILGFERGNNRGSDVDARGALGLLWVSQASALEVQNPNSRVRDDVISVLEGRLAASRGDLGLMRSAKPSTTITANSEAPRRQSRLASFSWPSTRVSERERSFKNVRKDTAPTRAP